jgi:SNF2 family DNA or RNA helicase
VLVFSQFTSMLALIEEELRELGAPYALLTGRHARSRDTRAAVPGTIEVRIVEL